MLDFAAQKKLLDPLLKHPRNHNCADCDSISPTWASLDFGVFLCGNCSGAHRALGPTITRVRSANLDKWQEEWIANMVLGNEELNKYWQSKPSDRKPKTGASLNEIGRYVYEKYVKKRFVLAPDSADPLTSYKNGDLQISKEQPPAANQSLPPKAPQAQPSPPKLSQPPAQPKPQPKTEVSLLDFDFDAKPQQQQQPQQVQSFPQSYPQAQAQVQAAVADDDEFTDYAQPGSVTKEDPGDGLLSFDALMNQHKQAPQQQQHHHYQQYNDFKTQNMALHHPYNPSIAQHNLVYNAHFPQQQHQQQQPHFHPLHSYSANPNPGYQGHNYSPMGHYGYQQQQAQGQYGWGQVGVGSYWK